MEQDITESEYSAWSFSPLELILHSGPIEFFGLLFSTILATAIVVRNLILPSVAIRTHQATDVLLICFLLFFVGISMTSILIESVAGLSASGIDEDVARDIPIRQGRLLSSIYTCLLAGVLATHVIRFIRSKNPKSEQGACTQTFVAKAPPGE